MVKKKEGMEDASLTMRDFPECVCTICRKGGSNATRNIAAQQCAALIALLFSYSSTDCYVHLAKKDYLRLMMHIHSYSRFFSAEIIMISPHSIILRYAGTNGFYEIRFLFPKKCQRILRDLRGFLRVQGGANQIDSAQMLSKCVCLLYIPENVEAEQSCCHSIHCSFITQLHCYGGSSEAIVLCKRVFISFK